MLAPTKKTTTTMPSRAQVAVSAVATAEHIENTASMAAVPRYRKDDR